MKYDIAIITHRDLNHLAPQPAHLAGALSARGLRVAVVCTCMASQASHLKTIADVYTTDSLPVPSRLRFATLQLLGAYIASRAKLVVAFDINVILSCWLAQRLRRRLPVVLYCLEPFYGDYIEMHSSWTSRMGEKLLAKVRLRALVDVALERLELSSKLLTPGLQAFVVRNCPPLSFGAESRRESADRRPIQLVYAGGVTGVAERGLRLLLRGVEASAADVTLTIFSAAGANVVHTLFGKDIGRRVTVCDAVPRQTLAATLSLFDVGVVFYPMDGADIGTQLAAPNKVYEYLAAGLAVLASRNKTLLFISEEKLGWNIEAETPEGVANVLDQIARCGDLKAKHERARSAFSGRYNFEMQSRELVGFLCSQLVATRHRSGFGESWC